MANITEYLRIIKSAILGKDMRDAIHDALAATNADGAVTTNMLADGSVITSKLADKAVTTGKINDKAVTEAKIGDNAVTTGKIANSAVTEAKIGDNAVTTGKINNKAVTKGKLSDELVDRIFTHIQGEKLTITSPTLPSGANSKLETIKVRDDRIDLFKTTINNGLPGQAASSIVYITADGTMRADDVNLTIGDIRVSSGNVSISDKGSLKLGGTILRNGSMTFGSGGATLIWDQDAPTESEETHANMLLSFGSASFQINRSGEELNIISPDTELLYSKGKIAVQIQPTHLLLHSPSNEDSKIEITDEEVALSGKVMLDNLESIGITGSDAQFIHSKSLPHHILGLRNDKLDKKTFDNLYLKTDDQRDGNNGAYLYWLDHPILRYSEGGKYGDDYYYLYDVGDPHDLTTTDKSDIVSAINELDKDKADFKNSSNGFNAGNNSSATDGGVAIGNYASTASGGAIGSEAESKNGFAGGYHAKATGMGAAVGANTHAYHGAAAGSGAQAGNGFAGGLNAKCGTAPNGADIDCIQLGEGTNGNEKTLQIYGYQLLDKDGHIPAERIEEISVAANASYSTATLDGSINITRDVDQSPQYGYWDIELSLPKITISGLLGDIVLPAQSGFSPGDSEGEDSNVYAIYHKGQYDNPSFKMSYSGPPVSYILMDGNEIISICIYVGHFHSSKSFLPDGGQEYSGSTFTPIGGSSTIPLIYLRDTSGLESELRSLKVEIQELKATH